MDTFLSTLVLDPNLVYLALLAGLWMGVTAAYIPGTGLAEVTAFVLLAGSFIVLAAMPTNWVAVIAMVVGVAALLLLPFVGERYSRFSELGLLLQGVGGYFLFTSLVVSPILIGVTLLLGLAYNRLVLVPTIRSQRDLESPDVMERLIGMRGRVVKDLDPVGTVYVNRELWSARSDEHLTRDTPITVTERDGLELMVEKAKRDDFYHENGNANYN